MKHTLEELLQLMPHIKVDRNKVTRVRKYKSRSGDYYFLIDVPIEGQNHPMELAATKEYPWVGNEILDLDSLWWDDGENAGAWWHGEVIGHCDPIILVISRYGEMKTVIAENTMVDAVERVHKHYPLYTIEYAFEGHFVDYPKL